jgi:UDP-2-acetamido-3-amino-2,3-dideoxy-glucuronate N-acetyltransferase
MQVHPTAIIDPGAKVGAGTRIWHFCHLMPECTIGENCILGQNVFVDNNVVVGNRVKVQNNVSIYNGVILEDDVFLGPSMVFTNVLNPRSFIERKNEFRKTLIHKGATIGANATILCGVEIGSYAMIGAGTMVVKNILPYALVVGNPAQQIGWVSEAGITLDFTADGLAVCSVTGKKYRLKSQMVFPAG